MSSVITFLYTITVANVAIALYMLREVRAITVDRVRMRDKVNHFASIEASLNSELKRLKVELAEAWMAHYVEVNKLKKEIAKLKGTKT